MREELVKLIKEEEGFVPTPYLCPAGKWTIGYGSTFYEDGAPVKPGDPAVDQDRAIKIMEAHFEKQVYPVIARFVKVPLNDNQYDAIADFVYNAGAGNFQKSTLLKLLNAGDYQGAADEFPKWNMGGGKVLQGLVRRRKKTRDLFLK